MIHVVKEWAVIALLWWGLFLMVLAAVGMLKFPDVFCRGHAQTKATTLGICSMLLALWLHLEDGDWGLPIAAAVAAQVLTIPVAGHMIALLSFQKKVPRYRTKKVAYHEGYEGPDLEGN